MPWCAAVHKIAEWGTTEWLGSNRSAISEAMCAPSTAFPSVPVRSNPQISPPRPWHGESTRQSCGSPRGPSSAPTARRKPGEPGSPLASPADLLAAPPRRPLPGGSPASHHRRAHLHRCRSIPGALFVFLLIPTLIYFPHNSRMSFLKASEYVTLSLKTQGFFLCTVTNHAHMALWPLARSTPPLPPPPLLGVLCPRTAAFFWLHSISAEIAFLQEAFLELAWGPSLFSVSAPGLHAP